MRHDQQAQRLREIDDLLAECQRHDMTGVRVSYAQLRALRDAIASVPPAAVVVPEVQRSCATCKHAADDEESYPCRDCTMMVRWSAATPAPVAQKSEGIDSEFIAALNRGAHLEGLGDHERVASAVSIARQFTFGEPVAQKVPDDVARDADRYRFLISNAIEWNEGDVNAYILNRGEKTWRGVTINDAIDSAMLAAAQEQEGRP